MLNVVPEHQVVGGNMGCGGGGKCPKVHVGDKIKEMKILFSHVRINKMIRYLSRYVNHRITLNYSLEFRAQWRG